MQTAQKTDTIIFSFPGVRHLSMKIGLRLGKYTDPCPYHHLMDRAVPPPSTWMMKDIFVVCPNRIMEGIEDVRLFLQTLGKKPCHDGPGFLLGLMARLMENEMPNELYGKNLIAIEPDNPSSVFIDEDGHRCSLCVFRGGENRRLGLMPREWQLYPFWAIVAENIPLVAAP